VGEVSRVRTYQLSPISPIADPCTAYGIPGNVTCIFKATSTDSVFAAFNHSAGNDAEAEYDRLRDLARGEASKRSSSFDRVRY